MDSGTVSLIMNGVIGLLAWSIKSKHDDAMQRLNENEQSTRAASERLAKLEVKHDNLTTTLQEMRTDIRAIREKLEDK